MIPISSDLSASQPDLKNAIHISLLFPDEYLNAILRGNIKHISKHSSMLPPQSRLAWTVCITSLHILGVSSTMFRLYLRHRTRKLWWDDYITIPPLVMDCVYCCTLWIRLNQPIPNPGTIVYSYWLTLFPFSTIIWLSRASLALGITRIYHPRETAWYFGLGLFCLYMLLFIASILVSTLTCNGGLSTYILNLSKCTKSVAGRPLGGLIIGVCDVTSDLILISFPVYMLWQLKLPRNQRRLVLAAFSASILTVLSAVVFMTFTFSDFDLGIDENFIIGMISHLQAVMALIACNFLVVITFLYRIIRRYLSPIEESEYESDDIESTPSNGGRYSRDHEPHCPTLTDILDSDMSAQSVPCSSQEERNYTLTKPDSRVH